MPKTKEEKKKLLEDLEKDLNEQKIFVFFDFSKVKAGRLALLRKKVKELGGKIRVAKKSLSRMVFKKLGFDFDFKSYKGQLAFLFAFQDEILPLKALAEVEKQEENIKVVGGFLNKEFLSPERIKELELLPSKDVLKGKLVFTLSYPYWQLTNILKANLRNFVFILSQLKVKEK